MELGELQGDRVIVASNCLIKVWVQYFFFALGGEEFQVGSSVNEVILTFLFHRRIRRCLNTPKLSQLAMRLY